MKIHTHQPKPLVRVVAKQKGEKSEGLSIEEASLEEVKAFILSIVTKQKGEAYRISFPTRIAIRFATGKKVEAEAQITVYGLSPEEIKQLIVKELTPKGEVTKPKKKK